MIKVLLIDKLNPRAVEALREIPEFDIFERTGMDGETLKKEIKNYEAAVVRDTPLERQVLANAANLKIIVRAGIGLDNIDAAYCRSRKIEVRDTPLATAITVAEYTLAVMLGICRFIGPSFKNMKEHTWERKDFLEGVELYGKTAGIIGFGRSGREVARRELALGMNVVYNDVIDIKTDIEARPASLDELLETSDFVSLHVPSTESTKKLISRREIGLMKQDAVLINVSGAGVVDEDALLDALDNNRIEAAGIDVFEREFPEEYRLIDNEKVYPSPTLGASTVEGRERAGIEVISILKDFFNV